MKKKFKFKSAKNSTEFLSMKKTFFVFFMIAIVFLSACSSSTETTTPTQTPEPTESTIPEPITTQTPTQETTTTATQQQKATTSTGEKVYKIKNIDDCKTFTFSCGSDEERFTDDVGCGCQPKTADNQIKIETTGTQYIYTDSSQCTNFVVDCGQGREQFKDDAGCGCRDKVEVASAYDTAQVTKSGKRYIIKDVAECTTVTFNCKSGEKQFKDDAGCGCEPA